ncbi:hypothetical protein HYW74_02900 [Candidatus Pacearchaeota archaeon]|nr:hypothetical protein [Candidatus Pacearchaeota archaeon]
MTSKKVEVAKQALLTGSVHILNLFGKSMEEIGAEYKVKDGDTPRTLIDTHSQSAILEEIIRHQEFKGDRFNAEESGAFGSGDRVWYVDPYDGTSNAQIIMPMSTSGIGIVEESRLVASVMLQPFVQERRIYWAERGEGAYSAQLELVEGRLVEKEDTVKRLSTDTKSGKASNRYAWVDALFNAKTTDRKNLWIKQMVEAGLTQNVRETGSNIDYSIMVASGRGHYQLTDAVGGFFDLCGYNLIEEAGGRMVNINGEEPKPGDQVAIAVANPKDLDTVLRITRECYKDYKGFR